MPVVYAYATTMRRAQGSTLDLVGLKFDRRRADRGYAYVGVSRAQRQEDVYHLGHIRRSDWRPVGGDPRGNEQEYPGSQSMTDSEGASDMSNSDSHSDEDPSMDTPDESDEDRSPNESEMEDESEPEDETAWNRFHRREWESLQNESSDETPCGFQGADPEDSDPDTQPLTKPDWAGLFE